MKKKQYDQAQELFTQISLLDPDNQLVAGWKKEIEQFLEDKRAAEQTKQVQAEINKRAWDVYNEAMAIKKQGHYHAAIDALGKVADIGSSDQKPVAAGRKGRSTPAMRPSKPRAIRCSPTPSSPRTRRITRRPSLFTKKPRRSTRPTRQATRAWPASAGSSTTGPSSFIPRRSWRRASATSPPPARSSRSAWTSRRWTIFITSAPSASWRAISSARRRQK